MFPNTINAPGTLEWLVRIESRHVLKCTTLDEVNLFAVRFRDAAPQIDCSVVLQLKAVVLEYDLV